MWGNAECFNYRGNMLINTLQFGLNISINELKGRLKKKKGCQRVFHVFWLTAWRLLASYSIIWSKTWCHYKQKYLFITMCQQLIWIEFEGEEEINRSMQERRCVVMRNKEFEVLSHIIRESTSTWQTGVSQASSCLNCNLFSNPGRIRALPVYKALSQSGPLSCLDLWAW